MQNGCLFFEQAPGKKAATSIFLSYIIRPIASQKKGMALVLTGRLHLSVKDRASLLAVTVSLSARLGSSEKESVTNCK
jgi:hypothetical protein